MSVRLACGECGYVGTYKSPALASYHHGQRHSCERHREREAKRQRIAERIANRRDGVVRDCTCKIARHQHGTRQGYVIDKCRCLPCRDAATAYEKKRVRQKAYGRTGRVDAAPAREHLLWLMTQGTSYKHAARLSGVSLTVISTLIYGRPDRRGHKPPYTCSAATAERILAVQPDPWQRPDGARVNSTGTHRRVQALVYVGWSQQHLANRIGMNRANFFKLMLAAEVTVGTAKKIRVLYDELWNVTPPRSTHAERSSYTRSRKHAAAHGWLPPLAWDDDSIDDPDAEPYRDRYVSAADRGIDEIAVAEAIRGRAVHLTPGERAEAVRRLTERGCSAALIAERLHTTERTVTRRRARGIRGAA